MAILANENKLKVIPHARGVQGSVIWCIPNSSKYVMLFFKAVLKPLLQALLQPLSVALWVVCDMASCYGMEPHNIILYYK